MRAPWYMVKHVRVGQTTPLGHFIFGKLVYIEGYGFGLRYYQ
jgi:hypothetical protein